MNSGIYIIVNISTNMYYVGSAFDFNKRWKNHKIELELNRHCNPYLQSAWNKYGKDDFKFYVLEHVHKTKLEEREQYWIDYLNCCNRTVGYNLCAIAGSVLGRKASEETKALLSKIRKGKARSEETKAKISAALKGRKFSKESLARMSESHKGHKHSEETKRKMSEGRIGNQYRKGSKLSYEHFTALQAGRKRMRKSLDNWSNVWE